MESRPAATPFPDKKLLFSILKRLQMKGTLPFFSVPVGPNEFPDYHAIVKQPMDFSTIRGKLEDGLYSNLQEFEADIYLICSNASCYFKPNNLHLWQADSIFHLAKKVFKILREEDKIREEEEEEEEEEEKYELGLEELENLEAEFKQLALGKETNDDDDDDDADAADDDDDEVEQLTIPMVVDRIVSGNQVYEIVVPVIKDDNLITPSMYYDDILPTETKKHFAQKLEISKELLPKGFECPVCLEACDLTRGAEHQASALPCGHIFGGSCIREWIERVSGRKRLEMESGRQECPKCNHFFLLDDIRPIQKTSLRIPPVDPVISARRFSLSNLGFLQFHKFETARRNIALIKWSRARMRLDDVLRRVKVYSRRADKNLQQAGKWKAEAEAWNVKAEALKRRAKGYNQRVNAHIPRLEYFSENIL